MLKDFETITEDANDFEINKVIPILVKGLSRYKGKDNAISGSTIIKRLNESLEQRISQQEKVVKALIWQRNQCM